jgi:hypothetical protein
MTHYSGWFVQNQKIFVTDWKGKSRFFCPEIQVTRRYQDIATKAYILKLKFRVSNQIESVKIARRQLAEKLLAELIDKGFSITATEHNAVTLAEILMEQEALLPIGFCHTKLGYHYIHGQRYFLSRTEMTGAVQSMYVGNQDLSMSGTLEAWLAFVQDAVHKNPLLILPLAMGASAPVATRLKFSGYTDETLLWALIGATSSGKTTCLRLACSPWGKPSGEGLIDNLTGTEKYFIASLAAREGYPNFLDETSAVTWDFSKMIYTVALSREGGRCNPDGTPKKRKIWSGAVVFTGETSLFLQSSKKGGLHARLIEFPFPWFGSDGQQAEAVGRFVSKNHGTAWVPFMQELEAIEDIDLEQRVDQAMKEIKKTIVIHEGSIETEWEQHIFSGIQERIIKKLSMLLATVDIMGEAWKLECDRATVLKYLQRTYEHNVACVDKIEEFFEDLVQHIVTHRNEFPMVTTARCDMSAHVNARGFQTSLNGKDCVWILASEFEHELHKHGLDPSGATLKELSRRGMIHHFGDRFRKKFQTGKLSPSCYCFFPNAMAENASTNHASKDKSSRKTN